MILTTAQARGGPLQLGELAALVRFGFETAPDREEDSPGGPMTAEEFASRVELLDQDSENNRDGPAPTASLRRDLPPLQTASASDTRGRVARPGRRPEFD